jgi:hypothetical protein
MIEHLFFYVGLACLALHEMDAVRCHEWRILPGLSALPEVWGFRVFMLAHIPIFAWLFAALADPTQLPALARGFDWFFVVHLGLHLLFLLHRNNEFKDWMSWLPIVGAAVCGFIDLTISL